MSTFRFQQFSVLQQRSGMKVCTDAVLFGAMAPLHPGDRVLDIGTGTGVLALMAAQLGAAKVTGVELTQEAYEEAGINFNLSPWAHRIEAVHQDIQGFALAADSQYDLIMSNPPFFANHSKTTASLRNAARHTDLLSFSDLISSAGKLLAEQGLLYVLIPISAVEKFSALALAEGFYLINRIDYRGYAHTRAKVSALTFSRTVAGITARLLTVYESVGMYTKESERYLGKFLLRFSPGRQAQQ
ncbi:tRNA1(Val) (adenine(37)-N6)-methyltransferase [Candidatus Methylobacter favarea]|uniref:tRNA1(Val) (adenine(37)-N6)-methyltransferase n=1 Tax=Candidatus Methylobacter favarea TaxID=2707345 RepID=A0A8S0Y6G0_9GAMM|nr:methyltransferase [Candidatus Methylobacter favarea]CAA9891303.1 tRNA1(Val) (adenine(37)-N6)-methyltransferase [Candidatus Methylobacter favarea]